MKIKEPETNFPLQSAFRTYSPSPGPYVSIVPNVVPTSISHGPQGSLMMRPPHPAASMMGQQTLLIGPGGASVNSALLAQSPSNLGQYSN